MKKLPEKRTITICNTSIFYSWYCRVGTDLWYFNQADCPEIFLKMEEDTTIIESGFGWFFGDANVDAVGPFYTREDAVGAAQLLYPDAA